MPAKLPGPGEEIDRESLLANGPARGNRDPQRWSEFDQGAGFFLLGLIYALVLTWLGWGLAGGGHGPALFLAVSLPGVLFWPAAGGAIAAVGRPDGRWVCPAVVIVAYLLTLNIINGIDREDARYVAKAWGGSRAYVLAFLVIFLAGQAAIWGTYVCKRRNSGGRNSSERSITVAGAMVVIVVIALLTAIVGIPVGRAITYGDGGEALERR